MGKSVFDNNMVFFTVVFLSVLLGTGNALTIDITPSNVNGLIHNDVSMTCRLDNSDGDVREIMVLELSRNDVAVALLRSNTQLTVGKGMESKFQADGNISTSSIYDSYIHVTMSDPEVKDSGSYSCFVFFLNQAGILQETKRSANLSVSDQDMKAAVKYLVEKVSGLESDLQEHKNEETKLQAQVTALTNQTKALENEDTLLRSELASQEEKHARELQDLQDKINGLTHVVNKCPTGWQFFQVGYSCLKAHIEKKSFSAARQTCHIEGGDLVKVDSLAKNNIVQALFRGHALDDIWIGLWDLFQTGHWHYLDGSPLTYTNWNRGQPDDNGGKEQCGHIRKVYDGKWNDWPCTIPATFVCEMPVKT